MVTANVVLNNLIQLIGQEFSKEKIMSAFSGFQEEGKTDVIIENNMKRGYDKLVHIDTVNNTKFCFRLRKRNDVDIIEDVWMI